MRARGCALAGLTLTECAGSGAAFAFEDAYVLKHAIDFARRRSQTLGYALELFDTVRAPRYKELVCT